MDTQAHIKKELTTINQPLGVISSVNEQCGPHATTVYYICDDLLNLYFVTRKESKKYKNIEKNPHVAFVITTENPPRTIQIEGIAREVTDPHEESEYFTKLISLASERVPMPPVSQIGGSEVVFMKIKPSWVRVGNFEIMKEGEKFIEITL